jgi:YVTN family beta-propeller protein
MPRLMTIAVLAALACEVVSSASAQRHVARESGLRAKGTVWATSRGPDTVTAFDSSTGKVLATVKVGKAPMGLALPAGSNKLYVGNEGSNSVSVISVKRREVIATIDVGSRPHHMYASPDGSRVYVAEFGTNKIGVIDTMTDSLIAEWTTGSPNDRTHAPAPSPDGVMLYAVNSGSNKIVALDARTGAIEWSMATGDNPSELHVARDGRIGYLSVRNQDELDVVDLVTHQVVRKVAVGDQPDTIQIAPDEAFLVVALRATPAEVDVVDLRSFSVTKVVFPGVRLTGHNWFSANGRYTFVSLDDPGGVGAIDHRTNSVVATWSYPGGGSVHGMFYDDPRATDGPGMSIPTRRAQATRKGVVRVTVACAEETAAFCKGTLRLASGSRFLGAAGFTVKAGASARLAVRLTAPARQVLARRGTVAARAIADGADLFGHDSKVSRQIVLRDARG